MREILLINKPPKAKKTKKNKKSGTKSPSKKGLTKMAKKRTTRKNRKRITRRVSKSITRSLGGLNFKSAFKDMTWIQIGMFSSKWAAKRFGEAAMETDPESWNWASYAKGAFGAVGAAMIFNMLKPGVGQKILEGGLNLMVYKAIQNELISKNEWAVGQFGQDDDPYVPDEYQGLMLAGETPEGDAWMYGLDGEVYPADDQYRMMGDALEPVGPLGDALEPVGPLGNTDPWAQTFYAE